ncbi:MAG: porin family protein [Gammaproteobacteria bacterium]|nr:porin family protein [Gammaproteobacteria bacterium]
MKTWFSALMLVIFSLTITHTTLAVDKEFDWYALGSGSLLVSEKHSVNMALRVGAGLQVNERFGFELFWDFTGIEPTNLIQKANLPMTIAPLKTDVQSYRYQYLTALAVRTFPLREPFSLVGKFGLAHHWQSIELDVLTSGSVFMESVEVDERDTLPVASLGIELESNRFKKLSLEFSITNYFDDGSQTALFTAAAKFKF